VQTSELQFFKDMLLNRKQQILKNIDGVNSELSDLSNLELNDEGDYAAANNNTAIEGAIAQQQIEELEEIDNALKKIENGGYGVCEMCEDDIGFQRLKVKPHAIYCIDCREIAEKNQ